MKYVFSVCTEREQTFIAFFMNHEYFLQLDEGDTKKKTMTSTKTNESMKAHNYFECEYVEYA